MNHPSSIHQPNGLSRRRFIANTAGACLSLLIPFNSSSAIHRLKKTVKVGVITDLHQDIIHDAPARLGSFVQNINKVKPDAIMQMGDFAIPADKNKDFIGLFNQAHDKRLHVIGNHDTDAGYTKEQVITTWGMPAPYYVQEVNGISFIVLDGNDKGSPAYKSGYPAFIGSEQTTWLKEKLKTIDGPIVIVSHQPLAGPVAVDNAAELQDILSGAANKILVALNGHTHIDAAYQVKNVHYVHVNSASYFWLGNKFAHESYSADIHQSHPVLASTCPYKDALFTTLTIDPQRSVLYFEGRSTDWVGKTPDELNYYATANAYHADMVRPSISKRKISK